MYDPNQQQQQQGAPYQAYGQPQMPVITTTPPMFPPPGAGLPQPGYQPQPMYQSQPVYQQQPGYVGQPMMGAPMNTSPAYAAMAFNTRFEQESSCTNCCAIFCLVLQGIGMVYFGFRVLAGIALMFQCPVGGVATILSIGTNGLAFFAFLYIYQGIAEKSEEKLEQARKALLFLMGSVIFMGLLNVIDITTCKYMQYEASVWPIFGFQVCVAEVLYGLFFCSVQNLIALLKEAKSAGLGQF